MSPALGKGQAVISEEALREKQANRTGEGVEPLLAGTNSPKHGTTKGQSQTIDWMAHQARMTINVLESIS